MTQPEITTPQTPTNLEEPSGIGGWLVLPAIGLIVCPFKLVYSFWVSLLVPMNGKWIILWSAEPRLAIFVGLMIAANIISLALVLWTAWHFFHKNKRAPFLYCTFLVFVMVFELVDCFLVRQIYPERKVMPNNMLLLSGAIWLTYFLNSKRVRNTFIR